MNALALSFLSAWMVGSSYPQVNIYSICLLLQAVPNTIFFLFPFFLPESPRWLAIKGIRNI
jgi:hypothetical protein